MDITFNHLTIFPQFEEGMEEFLSPYPCTKIFTNITRIDTVKEFLENNIYEEMEDVEKINNMLKEKKV